MAKVYHWNKLTSLRWLNFKVFIDVVNIMSGSMSGQVSENKPFILTTRRKSRYVLMPIYNLKLRFTVWGKLGLNPYIKDPNLF